MTIKKLTNHPGAQCKVRLNDDGTIDFISYTTLVIKATPFNSVTLEDRADLDLLDPAGNVTPETLDNVYFLECTGTYSRTTARQISWFLREYFGDISYASMKEIAGSEDTVVIARRICA